MKGLSCDIVILGAGVVGLSMALELRRQGLGVIVLEKSLPGQEASWAGAGMLPPGYRLDHSSSEARLRAMSHQLWNSWADQLSSETGIDIGYRRQGAVGLIPSGDSQRQLFDDYAQEGVIVEKLSCEELRFRFGCQSSTEETGFFIREFGQVRNPRYLRALQTAFLQAGGIIKSQTTVAQWNISTSEGIRLTTTNGEVICGDKLILATGAWTQHLLRRSSDVTNPGIRPIRGQIALLKESIPTLSTIIECGKQYVVPRGDGYVLIGSTEDDCGFDRSTQPESIQQLVAFGTRLVPSLRDAQLERSWAGLRPWNGSTTPWIGWMSEAGCGAHERVLIAAGHFRHGLQMSPATAQLARQLILQQPTAISLPPISPELALAQPA